MHKYLFIEINWGSRFSTSTVSGEILIVFEKSSKMCKLTFALKYWNLIRIFDSHISIYVLTSYLTISLSNICHLAIHKLIKNMWNAYLIHKSTSGFQNQWDLGTVTNMYLIFIFHSFFVMVLELQWALIPTIRISTKPTSPSVGEHSPMLVLIKHKQDYYRS